MLKWTKKDESKSMSGAVKRRATAPPGSKPMSAEATTTKRGVSQNGSAATSPTLTYPAEASDDVNMNEVDGLVSLDVTLPSGQRTDISVDYNTPMLDLLVCLAGKSKMSPSGLTLQLVSEDTGKPMMYKPNQTIGSLGGRVVRIVSKDELSGKSKPKSSKKDKPFEVTHRFTVNLPRAQRTVVRVSPLTTLGDLVTSVCQEKNLDIRRHILQIPGKPGVEVNLNATIQEIGVHEMNLIAVGLQERNHTVSMPDLSRPPPSSDHLPTYMPSAGEHKKKRGFLSFLSKNKDKKYKPQDARYSMETSSTTSHMMSAAQARKPATPPSSQRRGSDSEQPSARPKSMFVGSSPAVENEDMKTPRGENVQSVAAPARKKRRAPAPPAPSSSQTPPKQLPASSEISVKSDKDSKDNKSATQDTHNTPATTVVSQREDVPSAPASVSVQQVSRAEMLSRLHSRNSSDSSGYHELTLSGCESPEAPHPGVTKYKNSIDTTSIESTDNANGDSGIHESPIRVSPIEEVQEKSEANSVSAGNTDTLPSKKRRKAPAPPAPTPTPSSSTTTTTTTITANTDATKIKVEAKKDSAHGVQKPADLPTAKSSPSQPEQPPQPSSNSQKETVLPTTSSKEKDNEHETPRDKEDPYLSDIAMDTNESSAFDINDILEGVVFDEEPRSMELRVASDRDMGDQDKDPMMMVETSSVTSENIEQVDVPTRSERPCSFIPPPPPLEPPPPEQPVVDIKSLASDNGPMLVDKGTEVNDDNTSLAPSSAKSSPGTVSSGYKSEMALFVERMSKMAVESTEDGENEHLDESGGSLSIPGSDNNSDTGSVIHHQRTDSRSGSENGSLTRKEGMKISSDVSDLRGTFQDHPDELQEPDNTNFAVSEEISVPVETVPPPPEFGDKGSSNDVEDTKEQEEEEEEEEYFFSETVEELIIPLGPNGPDYSQARRVNVTETVNETVKKTVKESPRETERRGSTGVFRAEPVAVAPVSSTPTPIYQSQPKPAKPVEPPAPPKPVEKEEFVLTTEDLSNVSFLPPKPKLAKPYVKTEPYVHVSSTSLLMGKQATPIASSSSKANYSENGNGQHKVSQISFTPRAEAENDSVMEEKSISLLNLPSMRPSARSDHITAFSDDDHSDTSNDPLLNKLTPRLLMNSHPSSHSSGSRKTSNDTGSSSRTNDSSHRSSFDNGAVADIGESLVERPGSRASAYSMDTQEQQEALQAQYYSLQAQFGQWQEQLARNQNLLASQAIGPELQNEQLQQLTDQMAMQQQMMQQLQATMLALQQQQQQVQGNGQEHRASSGELPARVPEPAAAAAEPAPVVAVAPPPPPAPAPQLKAVKTENTKARPKPKSRFEPELDPREQLMIAIRNFSRGGLRSVPVQQVKWVHSNR